jgi:hypothetical protein
MEDVFCSQQLVIVTILDSIAQACGEPLTDD